MIVNDQKTANIFRREAGDPRPYWTWGWWCTFVYFQCQCKRAVRAAGIYGRNSKEEHVVHLMMTACACKIAGIPFVPGLEESLDRANLLLVDMALEILHSATDAGVITRLPYRRQYVPAAGLDGDQEGGWL